MSYSFNVRGADRHEVDRLAALEFEKIVASQPMHEVDRNQARTAVHGFTQMLGTPTDGMELSVSVAGSISWEAGPNDGDAPRLTATSLSVSAMVVQKET